MFVFTLSDIFDLIGLGILLLLGMFALATIVISSIIDKFKGGRKK